MSEDKLKDAKPAEKPAIASAPATPTPAIQEPTTEKSLIDRIMGVVEDVMKAKLTEFEKKIDTKIDTLLKTKEVEVEQALRKGFGLENDPVVHMSDLIAHGRKLGLETSAPEKRSPATSPTPGPEGIQKAGDNEIDKLFDEAVGVKKEAVKS